VYPLGRGEKAVGEYTKKIVADDRKLDQLNYLNSHYLNVVRDL
jgi:hypothetical protein